MWYDEYSRMVYKYVNQQVTDTIYFQPPKKLNSEKEKQEKIIWTDKFYEGSKGIKTLW